MSGDHPNGDPMIVLPTPPLAKAPADRFTGDARGDGITDGAGGGCTVSDGAVSREGMDRRGNCHTDGRALHVTDERGRVGPGTDRTS